MPLGPDPATVSARRADWRVGPVVYQIFPDRFAPPEGPVSVSPPRRARPWTQTPRRGRFSTEAGVWTHELDFWGGTLDGVTRRLDYLSALGVDVVYLNPICDSLTNHRYDARDWASVAPELGGVPALRRLAAAAHGRGMRLMLDGVFNHLGRSAPRFQAALREGRGRHWFSFGPEWDGGYRGWHDVANLPEVSLEHPEVLSAVRAVVGERLRDGVDGWRLDVAHDLGPRFLSAIRDAAREVRADAWVVGEIWAYPAGWLSCIDGLLNMHLRRLVLTMLDGDLSGAHFGRLLGRLVADCGIDGLLRSWLVIDNHDTARLASRLPASWQQALAWTLQATLPGAPVVYYGSEVGLRGVGDPTNRGPMRWDRVDAGHPALGRLRGLLDLRRRLPALRLGDCTALDTEQLLAYLRSTDRIAETVLVVINPTAAPLTERLVLPDPRLMTGSPLVDAQTGQRVAAIDCGTVSVTVPARSARILSIEMPPPNLYNPYRRIDGQ